MTVLHWVTAKPYIHLGKEIVVPAWQSDEELADIEDTDGLAQWLSENNIVSSWWQFREGSKRLFCHWINAPKDMVLAHGLHISDRDPPMVAVNAGWVETSARGRRFTGRVAGIRYGEIQNPNWVYFEGSTYEFLSKLAEQFKHEKEYFDARKQTG